MHILTVLAVLAFMSLFTRARILGFIFFGTVLLGPIGFILGWIVGAIVSGAMND